MGHIKSEHLAFMIWWNCHLYTDADIVYEWMNGVLGPLQLRLSGPFNSQMSGQYGSKIVKSVHFWAKEVRQT